MKPWVCEGVAKDGQQHSNQNPPGPHEPYENYGEDCVICNLTKEQVVGGSKAKSSSFPVRNLAILGALALLLLGAGWFFFLRSSDVDPATTGESLDEPVQDPAVGADPEQASTEAGAGDRQGLYTWEPERFSWGNRTLFSGDRNVPRDEGIAALNRGDYSAAADSFERAVSGNRNDPEVLIFYNNALARQSGNPYTIAAVVPVEGRSKSAEEMLRGVAQAQNQFNASGGRDGRLLEVVIANDGNNLDSAAQAAEAIASDDSVLGVIGHNSSSASAAALPIYEAANLPMISPTSTSTALNSDLFFRTVPSDAASARMLAQYANDLGISRALIFYDPDSTYSDSLRAAFESEFSQLGGESTAQDMTDPGLRAAREVFAAAESVEALLLFPSTDYTRVAIELAGANSDLPEGNRLALLGGDSLYSVDTLVAGGDSTEGLVLPVAWFSGAAQFEDFSQASENQWGGPVSWRTATSFDATQALIQSLSEDATRTDVLADLVQVDLTEAETSGQSFSFSGGERDSEPVLVRVVRGSTNRVPGSEFGYELVSE